MSNDSTYFKTDAKDGATVITVLDADLLTEGRDAFHELAKDLATDSAHQAVILNLEKLDYFKSVMLAALINFQKQLKAADKPLKLCGVKSDVLRLFELTKLTEILEIHPDEATALQSLKGSSKGWFAKTFGFGK